MVDSTSDNVAETPNQIIRSLLVKIIQRCRATALEHTGTRISVVDVFIILEVHSAGYDGHPDNIASIAKSLGVATSTVPRSVRRLEKIGAILIQEDGASLRLLGDPKWIEMVRDDCEVTVRLFLEASDKIREYCDKARLLNE